MDSGIQDESVTTVSSTILTTTAPHGYGYGHYISYYGHYSYILLILMGITVLLGSLLVAYVKKIDSGIMRRSSDRERGRCNNRCQQADGDSDCESDDLKKHLPPEYQVALEMPRPDIDDYSRFFEYTLVHSNASLRPEDSAKSENPATADCDTAPTHSSVAVSVDDNTNDDVVVAVNGNEAVNEELPTYDEYIQSMSEINEN